MASSSDELLQAEAELWCHAFGYLKSTALRCAIKLGIPNAIHRCGGGGAASLSELHAAVPLTASKRACFSRLMRFLAVSGIFREEAAAQDGEEAAGSPRYSLTPVSRLLVTPDGGNGGAGTSGNACLSQLILLINCSFLLSASQCLADWLQEEDGAEAETPLAMALGGSLFSVTGTNMEYRRIFNEAMASDSRFVAEIVVRECREVFTGVASLVDVGGGDGTMAAAIAKAFPQIRCSVLELPRVVDAVTTLSDCAVEFVAGDMMEFIPPADVVLLKWIMHNWTDEDCVRILKRCKEAISTREPKGKVVIIDVVVGSQSKHMLEAQLVSDLCMMLLTTGEERDMEKWQRIFRDAGFTHHKISPVLGFRSLVELYP